MSKSRAPAGLVAAALALWGVSTGQLALALVLAAAFEVAARARPSAAMAARLKIVVQACGFAALGLLAYVATTLSLPSSLYTWLRWLPLIVLPVPVFAELAGGLRVGERRVDTTHAYAALALAAAGTGTGAGAWLYPGFAAIAGWALLARQPRERIGICAVMFVGAAAIGHGAHTGIWLLQGQVEELSTELFQELFSGKTDPYRERTRIGDLGRIKLSDRIVMRVEADGPRPDSILLREASFERYRNGEWHNIRAKPRPVPRDGERWVLSDLPASRHLGVRRSFADSEGMLPLPAGARSIEGLRNTDVEAFPPGTARIRGAPRFAAFGVTYDPEADRSPPDPKADLEIPQGLAEPVERAIASRGLAAAGGNEAVAAVRRYFDEGYSYSLELGSRTRTLADFLLRERKGHCEYFASGTVMMLRALGVPARYATGYSVQEWSGLERAFVVRNRHAHAWAQAWVDGRWIDVDTTPARWADLEGEAARGLMAPVLDALSWAFEAIVRAWIGADTRTAGLVLGVLALTGTLVTALVLAWRRWRPRARTTSARPDAIARAWRNVEERLARAGHRRNDGETVRAFAVRVARDPRALPWAADLQALVRGYYRARFDPAVPAGEAADFIEAARRWAIPRQGRST